MNIPTFKILFYKGDTPALVVHLLVNGQAQDLLSMSAKLYIQGYTITANISGTKASFCIPKLVSEVFQVGVFKIWMLVYNTANKYSYLGVARIKLPRTVNNMQQLTDLLAAALGI